MTSIPAYVPFKNVAFVVVNDPVGWYQRSAAEGLAGNVHYLVFQVEHCVETGALCVRGFAQGRRNRTRDQWRVRLQLGMDANIQDAPGSVTSMAKQCMTAGVDVNGLDWKVAEPHVELGRMYVTVIERMCIDIQNNLPHRIIESKYPQAWRKNIKSMLAYERILNNCASVKDWECAEYSHVRRMLLDARAQLHFKRHMQTDPDSFLALDEDDGGGGDGEPVVVDVVDVE